MEMALWFLAGYIFHSVFSLLYRYGLSVTVMKVAEIRALELLLSSQEQYELAKSMLDLAAQESNRQEEMKGVKNLLRAQHRDWQDETIVILKKAMGEYSGLRKWHTWSEATQYLADVKKDERIKRLLNNNKDRS